MAANKIEKFFFSKVELWLVLLLMLAGVVGFIVFSNAALEGHNKEEDAGFLARNAYKIASIPDNLAVLLREGLQYDPDRGLVEKNPQILDYETTEELTRFDKDFVDDGLLLVSAYNPEHRISSVYLYDLRTEEKLWEWVPDYDAIIDRVPRLKQMLKENPSDLGVNSRELFRTQHPLLLDNGSIVFSSGEGPVVKLSAEGEIIWVLEEHYHHSIEQTREGDLMIPYSAERGKYLDQPIGIFDANGTLKKSYSFIDILVSNGHRGILWGIGTPQKDFIHLNDAEEIHESDEWVKAGDIMLSARNISTALLYRPSENRIIWLKTGPWIAQHDIDYLGDGRFAIFGNDLPEGYVWNDAAHSNIYVYDMKTDTVSKPYEKVFKEHRLRTATQGLQRILRNGDAFIELQNSGRLMRISPTTIRWSYVNIVGENEIGIVHWCRYLYRDEVNLDWIEEHRIKD